jgi:hypothetical protein
MGKFSKSNYLQAHNGKILKTIQRLFNHALDSLNLPVRKLENWCEVVSHIKANFQNYNFNEKYVSLISLMSINHFTKRIKCMSFSKAHLNHDKMHETLTKH